MEKLFKIFSLVPLGNTTVSKHHCTCPALTVKINKGSQPGRHFCNNSQVTTTQKQYTEATGNFFVVV